MLNVEFLYLVMGFRTRTQGLGIALDKFGSEHVVKDAARIVVFVFFLIGKCRWHQSCEIYHVESSVFTDVTLCRKKKNFISFPFMEAHVIAKSVFANNYSVPISAGKASNFALDLLTPAMCGWRFNLWPN